MRSIRVWTLSVIGILTMAALTPPASPQPGGTARPTATAKPAQLGPSDNPGNIPIPGDKRNAQRKQCAVYFSQTECDSNALALLSSIQKQSKTPLGTVAVTPDSSIKLKTYNYFGVPPGETALFYVDANGNRTKIPLIEDKHVDANLIYRDQTRSVAGILGDIAALQPKVPADAAAAATNIPQKPLTAAESAALARRNAQAAVDSALTVKTMIDQLAAEVDDLQKAHNSELLDEGARRVRGFAKAIAEASLAAQRSLKTIEAHTAPSTAIEETAKSDVDLPPKDQ